MTIGRELKVANSTARQHLERARIAVDRSDAALIEAASEIRKALEADSSLTFEKVGAEIGRSGNWVTALLRWAEGHDQGEGMYSADRQARLTRATRQGLRELSDDDLRDVMNDAETWVRVQRAYYANFPYTPTESAAVSPVEHFRRYVLSRLNPWGLSYDWKHLSETEKLELAPDLERSLETLATKVDELLAEVRVAA